MLKLGCERDIPVMPVYAVSDDPAATILDLAATLGVDFLMIGTSHRLTLTNLLRGNVVTNIAAQLPDTIRLIIYG
jgi:nucleotide-binding universal stress UspA family protein